MRKEKKPLTVFLDIDGVLNSMDDWRTQYSLNKKCVYTFYELWRELNKEYKPALVLISTWRAGKGRCQNSESYNYLEETLKSYNIKISGITPISNKGRQNEVEYYVRRNSISDYIVIDDDDSLYDRPTEIKLYCPDYKTGLTNRDICKIKKLIKKGRR